MPPLDFSRGEEEERVKYSREEEAGGRDGTLAQEVLVPPFHGQMGESSSASQQWGSHFRS
jgi:hypothetical protein